MKTIILSLLVITMACISFAQNVNIPDAHFKNALISAGVDINDDGEISYTECEAIKKLDVSQQVISDMTGIEAFVNLDTLFCVYNQLTSLDVSGCTALTSLNCWGNQLTNLDVTNNTALFSLYCLGNQLTSLDIANNTALEYLYCKGNQLTSLDVTNNTALIDLECYDNQLTSLDVSHNTALKYLSCSINQLTSLDVSKNTALRYLDCFDNQLTNLNVSACTALINLGCFSNHLKSLDVSGCTSLTVLYCSINQLTSLDVSGRIALKELLCSVNQLTSLDVTNNTALIELVCFSNQLTSLDVSKNTALEYLDISLMPDLYKVCVWEMPFPPANVYVNITDSPNVYFTTDCLTDIQGDYKENSTINIFPNPSDDIINIEIENIHNGIIEIYNVNGTLIFNKVLNSESEKIDISSFSSGLYFVKVKQDRNVFVEKVVVR
jgi:hypothetical protein